VRQHFVLHHHRLDRILGCFLADGGNGDKWFSFISKLMTKRHHRLDAGNFLGGTGVNIFHICMCMRRADKPADQHAGQADIVGVDGGAGGLGGAVGAAQLGVQQAVFVPGSPGGTACIVHFDLFGAHGHAVDDPGDGHEFLARMGLGGLCGVRHSEPFINDESPRRCGGSSLKTHGSAVGFL